MKKTIGFLAGCLLVGIIISCSSTSFEGDYEYTRMVTVGNGNMKIDLEDSIITISNSELEAYDLSKGDRAILKFTAGYSVSSSYATYKNIKIEQIIMRVPIEDVKVPTSEMQNNYTAAVGNVVYYGNVPIWVQDKYLTVGVDYQASAAGEFVLAADTVRGDTVCFTLYSKFSAGDKHFSQFYSYDMTSCRNLNFPNFYNKFSALDSMRFQVSMLFQQGDSTYKAIMGTEKRVNNF